MYARSCNTNRRRSTMAVMKIVKFLKIEERICSKELF